MINVNKLFRRLSIRRKLVIAFALLGVVPVAVLGGYGAVFSFSLLNQTVLDALKDGVALKAGEVQQALETVREDVVVMSRLPVVRALTEAGPEAARPVVERVEQAFLAFSQLRRAYHQIRYLDARGREVVRVDFDGERHQVVPARARQDRSGRYYFQHGVALRPGEVYVSPMDLDEEPDPRGSERRPIVHYATPLASAGGQARGVLVVDLLASRIFSQVASLGRERGAVFLLDARGAYLVRSRRLLAAPSTAATLAPDFPSDLAARVLSGRAGAGAEPGLRGRILAFAPIRPGPGPDFWVVVHAYSKGEVLSSIRSLQVLVLVLGGVVLLVALGAGVAAARHFTRPITALIEGAKAIAAGDFDRTIRVETNDELEDLSRQFNQMAGHLEAHERQLVAAREHAERKAREAQALSRIGTEISRLLSLPEILQIVVDKARELLGADVAILCLVEPGIGLRIGAASGPPEALSPRLGAGPEAGESPAEGRAVNALCPGVHTIHLPTHVVVPLRSGDRVLGNLCVGYRAMRAVDQDELDFLDGLASQAAVAIENARLHREVRAVGALEERQRIARDLHDGIIQSIYATGLGLEECVRLADEDPRELRRKLEEAIDGLNTVIRDVRNYVVGLGPEELQHRDLGGALDDLVRGLALNALVTPDLSIEDGIDRALGPEQAAHLFHICREALTNVVRHSRASRVTLTLRRDNGHLLLAVEDDGVGFDPAARAPSGQGLRNIGERARRLGGDAAVSSAAGHGTRLRVRVPLGDTR